MESKALRKRMKVIYKGSCWSLAPSINLKHVDLVSAAFFCLQWTHELISLASRVDILLVWSYRKHVVLFACNRHQRYSFVVVHICQTAFLWWWNNDICFPMEWICFRLDKTWLQISFMMLRIHSTPYFIILAVMTLPQPVSFPHFSLLMTSDTSLRWKERYRWEDQMKQDRVLQMSAVAQRWGDHKNSHNIR